MADNTFAFVIIFIWLIIITAALIGVAVGFYYHKIDIGFTGPTGPSQGPIGPTGPTGPHNLTLTAVNTPLMTYNFRDSLYYDRLLSLSV
jgi:hypothetical protein